MVINDKLNLTMLCDFYELTMSQGYFATGVKAAITGMDWLAMALICIILPAVLSWLIGIPCRKLGWIKDGDLKLD